MKKSDEMVKKIYSMNIRLDVIRDLENLIVHYERTSHEIPCDCSPELQALIQKRYGAKISLVKNLIEAADYMSYFDTEE